MEKLTKDCKMWFITAVASAAVGAVAVAGIIIFALKLWYAPLIISVILTANAFYGCPFYVIFYKDTKLYRKIVEAVEKQNMTDISAIAEFAGIKPEFSEFIVSKCIKKGYLPGYVTDNGTVKRTEG